MVNRKKIGKAIKLEVLTECGFRCAVPTCRTILLYDLHHIIEVHEGGDNNAENLLPLCPNCHALYHRKEIPIESIRTWKQLIWSLNKAFDHNVIDDLLFISQQKKLPIEFSSDGLARFSRLIGAGLIKYQSNKSEIKRYSWLGNRTVLYIPDKYYLSLTEKGKSVVEALNSGNQPTYSEVR